MAAPGCEEARAGGSALGAGPSPSGVARRRGRTLLVRHLPAELTAAEKEELLRHFGAAAVRVLADHGRLVRARGPGRSGGEPRGPGGEARPAALRWVLPCEGGGGDTALSPQLPCGGFLPRRSGVGAVIRPGGLFARSLVRSSLRFPSLPRFILQDIKNT